MFKLIQYPRVKIKIYLCTVQNVFAYKAHTQFYHIYFQVAFSHFRYLS